MAASYGCLICSWDLMDRNVITDEIDNKYIYIYIYIRRECKVDHFQSSKGNTQCTKPKTDINLTPTYLFATVNRHPDIMYVYIIISDMYTFIWILF